MESLSSQIVKIVLRMMRYKKPYECYNIDLKKARKDNIGTPRKGMCSGCKLSSEKIGENNVWHLHPKKRSNQNVILYFHGGGYIEGMVKEQWKTIAKIAALTGSKVVIPDYPLAPENTYKDVFSMISATYEKVLESTSAENISFIGDSAGGGLLLSFAMLLRNEGRPLPKKLVALSPWVDISMTNPEMEAIEKYDPMLAIPGIKRAGEMYAAGADLTNFLVSPLYGNLKGLPPMHIFAGTHDILFPDEKLYVENAREAGVEIYYYEYPKMVHCWMFLPIQEAKTTIKQIVNILLFI